MIAAQSVFRRDPENIGARVLLKDIAPRIWTKWQEETDRGGNFRTGIPGISSERIYITKHLRDAERYESAGMSDEALGEFREAELKILLEPPRPGQWPLHHELQVVEQGIERLSLPHERKR